MRVYLLAILLITIPALIYAQPCTVNDATGCVCEDGTTDCLLLPNIKIAYDVLVDSNVNPEYPEVLRVSVSTPNVGHGPLRVLATNNFVCGTDTLWNSNITICPDGSTPSQLVKQRIYKKEGNNMTYIDRWAGTMTYHPTHNHAHFDEWGVYTLRIPDPNDPDPLNWTIVGEGSKLGFCLMDYGSCEYYDGHCRDENDNTLTTDAPNYGLGGGSYSCGTTNQGISAGWTDVYYYNLDGMFIDIPAGTCNGDYMLVVEVDPNNVLLEENDDDNVMVAPITLTKQTNPANVTPSTSIFINGPTAICAGEQTELSVPRTGTAYLWSNGETTSTIIATSPGTYTCEVTTPCGVAVSDMVLIAEGADCMTGILLYNDNFIVNEDNVLSDNVLTNDNFPNNTNIIVNAIPTNAPDDGTVTLNEDGTFSYTPNNDFNGIDRFTYEACVEDNATVICNQATTYVTINPVNDAPIAAPDTLRTLAGERLFDYIIENDIDVENHELTASYVSGINVTGSLYILPSGYVSYTPDSSFVGTEMMQYKVCDNGTPILCDTSTLVLISEPNCIDIQLHAYLEGAYDAATDEMTTKLNTSRSILPGQTPTGNQPPTPAGQPYHIAPWNYIGQEGIDFTDADYPADVVDWVLISFREGIESNTEIAKTAALLHKDGTISFPDRCALSAADGLESVYVVIEHRNHIGVMSPVSIPINEYTLTYDFRASDSYRDATSYGQKLLTSGVWCMYAGDGDQSDFPSFDVTGNDKSIWVEDNGIFDYYRVSDFNLDGDVSAADKILWFENNGISSRVPK